MYIKNVLRYVVEQDGDGNGITNAPLNRMIQWGVHDLMGHDAWQRLRHALYFLAHLITTFRPFTT